MSGKPKTPAQLSPVNEKLETPKAEEKQAVETPTINTQTTVVVQPKAATPKSPSPIPLVAEAKANQSPVRPQHRSWCSFVFCGGSKKPAVQVAPPASDAPVPVSPAMKR